MPSSRRYRHHHLVKTRSFRQAKNPSQALGSYGGGNGVLHPALVQQLEQLGLDPARPPKDAAAWQALLKQLNRVYQSAPPNGNLANGTENGVHTNGALPKTPWNNSECQQVEDALRESEERYRILTEHATETIVVVDVETGAFVESNARAESLFGLSRDALRRTGPAEMSPEYQPDGRRSAEAAREEIMQALEGEVRVFEWTHRNAQGKEIPCEIRLVQLPLKGRKFIRGTITDITDRKQFEKELIAAREKAEELSRLKSAFLNNMSHEIRTPLTAIIGFSAILSEDSAPEHRELVELIEQSGKRLLNTLNAVLDLSMLEAGTLSLDNEWFNLVETVEEKVEELHPLGYEKGISLRVVSPVQQQVVYLDRTCLDRILTHLIDNAIKFTHEGGVQVVVGSDEEGVYVRVEDTGVGICAEFQSQLFDDFRQESTGLDRAHNGVGLGLAVTRRMVHLMGGQISVESEKGRGSAFIVSFPQPITSRGTIYPASIMGGGRPRPRLLVVEDTPEIELLVEYMLHDVYDVVTTPSEAGAMRLAHEQQFDLVLMDINLGGARTGVDVMHELRALPTYVDVPIVAMTAYALLEDRARFLAEGFDGYLSKPFTAPQAYDVIEPLLAR